MNTQRMEIGVLPTDVVLEQMEQGKRRAYTKGVIALLGVALGIVFLAYATAQLGAPEAFMSMP